MPQNAFEQTAHLLEGDGTATGYAAYLSFLTYVIEAVS